MTKHVTILSTSLSKGSKSHALACEALALLTAQGVSTTLLDLRELDLPQCGQHGAGDHPGVHALRKEVQRSTHVLFAAAIYNYDVSASAKNCVEFLSENDLAGKTAGFLCAAGGRNAFMAVMSFANTLMLDFRCWIVPRFVYATSGDFHEGKVHNADVHERIELLTTEMFSRGME